MEDDERCVICGKLLTGNEDQKGLCEEDKYEICPECGSILDYDDEGEFWYCTSKTCVYEKEGDR